MQQSDISFLSELESIIRQRASADGDESYTASLIQAGDKRIAQKVGEEAVELGLASVAGNRNEQLNEAADLVYHLLVLLHSKGIRLGEVSALLQDRHDR